MSDVMTVTGPVDAGKLGFCQCHEHLALRRGRSAEVDPVLCLDDLEKSVTEAGEYVRAGGNTLVEAQPVGCGRDARWLWQISRRTGASLIASTGFHKLVFYPEEHWIRTIAEDDFCALLCKELQEGMMADGDESLPYVQAVSEGDAAQKAIRAGIIKTAYDREELSPRYLTLFAAAVRCARETGRNLMIHVEAGTDPRKLLDFLCGRGLAPERQMYCHMDRACPDLSVHRDLLQAGAFLEYDTIGRFKYHSDEEEIGFFSAMAEAGHLSQLLYSLDTTRARLKTYTPTGVGLDYILTVFNPKLLSAGFSHREIDQISRRNPAVFFNHQGK